jgi:hypothetical protein
VAEPHNRLATTQAEGKAWLNETIVSLDALSRANSKRFAASALPALWNAQPLHQVSQFWGDALLSDVAAVGGKPKLPPIGCAVPSVLVEEDYNVTAHCVRAFAFDHRLVLRD